MKAALTTLLIVFSMLLGTSIIVPRTVSAVDPCVDAGKDTGGDYALRGVSQTSDSGNKCNDDGIGKTVNNVVSILSIVAGVIAVIFILISGFKFITSNGDSNKVASARSTLIGAVIGLAVVALAYTIVNFTIGTAKNSATACNNNPRLSKDSTDCSDGDSPCKTNQNLAKSDSRCQKS